VVDNPAPGGFLLRVCHSQHKLARRRAVFEEKI
jgi:hypothetical protein